MYRPSKYNISQASLEYFANHFNNCEQNKNILWIPIREETYDNDGWFLNCKTGETIGYDWEIRDRYFSNGKFDFDTLGQFERKLIKPSIKLSIQCDAECANIIVAWHKDFLKSERVNIDLLTDKDKQLAAQTRYTKEFKIFSINEMSKFKSIIDSAFLQHCFDHNIFDAVDCREIEEELELE